MGKIMYLHIPRILYVRPLYHSHVLDESAGRQQQSSSYKNICIYIYLSIHPSIYLSIQSPQRSSLANQHGPGNIHHLLGDFPMQTGFYCHGIHRELPQHHAKWLRFIANMAERNLSCHIIYIYLYNFEYA